MPSNVGVKSTLNGPTHVAHVGSTAFRMLYAATQDASLAPFGHWSRSAARSTSLQTFWFCVVTVVVTPAPQPGYADGHVFAAEHVGGAWLMSQSAPFAVQLSHAAPLPPQL